MTAGLNAITLALRALADTELQALTAATKRVPATLAPGLLAWFLNALDWELSRRAGLDHDSGPPAAAIPLGVPPLAPAVANAVAKLGGPRVRRLPFARAGLVET